MAHDVFISYHEDSAGELAEQIANALEAAGISCWYAKRNLPFGSDFARNIPPQINECRLFLLILNEGVYQSRHIENEVGLAFSRLNRGDNITILPLEIGDFMRKGWVAYYLIHTQSVKISSEGTAQTEEITNRIVHILGKELPKDDSPKYEAGEKQHEDIKLNRIRELEKTVKAFKLLLSKERKQRERQTRIWDKKRKWARFWIALFSVLFSLSILVGWFSTNLTVCLWTISLDKSVVKIYGIGAMNNYNPPDSVFKKPHPFYDDSNQITSAVISNKITSVGNFAFATCKNLSSVTIPKSVTEIGMGAFAYCESLSNRIPTCTVLVDKV